MDKPRPRPASAALIIEDPKLQSSGHRAVYAVLTALFWALWIYLWLPVITLIAWAFGVWRFADIMVAGRGLQALEDVLVFYLVVIVLMGGTLILWALYNESRFSGRERRRTMVTVHSSSVVAIALGQRESTVLIWQHARLMRVSHDEDGRIVQVTVIGEASLPNHGVENRVHWLVPRG